MPGLSSPLTGPDGQLMASASDLGQWAGFLITVTQASWITPTTGHLAKEIANPLLVDGTPIKFVGEPAGVFREYNATAKHARKVVFPGGTSLTLSNDSNAVLSAPSGGSAGDAAFDVNGIVFLNTSGTWAPVNVVDVPASRALLKSDLGKTLRITGAVTLSNTGASDNGGAPVGYIGGPSIFIRQVHATPVAYAASANLVDPGPFSGTLPQGLETVLRPTGAGVMTVMG